MGTIRLERNAMTPGKMPNTAENISTKPRGKEETFTFKLPMLVLDMIEILPPLEK
jgi:hypothetical protein